MNRQEFISLLTDALMGRVPSSIVSEKADYYRDYISGHARECGISEEAVIEEIGPPEAIAHTIVQVYEAENGPYQGSSFSGNGYGGSESSGNRAYSTEEKFGEENGMNPGGIRGFLMNGNYGCLIALFIVVVVAFAIGSWLIRFIAAYPVLVIILVAFYYFDRNRRRRR